MKPEIEDGMGFAGLVPTADERREGSEVKRLGDRIMTLTREREEARDAAVTLSLKLGTAEHEFQNFHRLLCKRFGYGHDPVDWRRDQLSLIEHIARLTWRPIETCPSDVCVLLYTPHMHITNLERVEARVYHDSRAGSWHAWATHWMPLPCSPPTT